MRRAGFHRPFSFTAMTFAIFEIAAGLGYFPAAPLATPEEPTSPRGQDHRTMAIGTTLQSLHSFASRATVSTDYSTSLTAFLIPSGVIWSLPTRVRVLFVLALRMTIVGVETTLNCSASFWALPICWVTSMKLSCL
jgi:hypothetical protein